MSGEDMPEEGRWRGVDGPGTARFLGHLPEVDVFDITCGMTDVGFTGSAPVAVYTIILASGGGFLYRMAGKESFIDTMSAIVVHPGDMLEVAHPIGFDDTSTVLQYADRPDLDLTAGARRVSDDLYLQHRALVAACRRGIDVVELGERVDRLLTELAAPEREARRGHSATRSRTGQSHRRLVDRAVEALVDDGFRSDLDDLASAAGTSRHHLSRVFRSVTGMTVTAYRNRLRVRAVLSDLQQGAQNLRDLAYDYGFADQSHLIRVVRHQFGRTPGELRRLLHTDSE